MRTSTLVVRTPEGISFPLLLAGPVTRFFAWLIDALCILVLLILLMIGLTLLALGSGTVAFALGSLGYFAISIGYAILLEWLWRGQTLGKRILRLRVMDAHGLRLQPSQIVIRNLLRFVDSLPVFYLVGGVACVLSRRCQRLGDLAANTIVVRQPKTTAPDLDQLLAGKFNSLLEHPHLAARLRQRVSPTEATIALQALLRRDALEPEARVALFRELASHLRALVPFPPETIENIPDEQYVRNVVDIVFRERA
jgi:uncharacterized RDD family membrane protein YckC